MPLYEKWRPQMLSEFVGQPRALAAMRSLVLKPRESVWAFSGDPGVGKTSLTLATAGEIGCSDEMSGLWYVPPGEASIERLRDQVWPALRFRPLMGAGWKFVVLDEADSMSQDAARFLRGALEKNLPAKTIVVLTSNGLEWASDALLSRCLVIQFDSEEMKSDVAKLLEAIWDAETGNRRPAQNFNALAGVGRKEPCNVRAAIGRLEVAIHTSCA
jgi:replication factor C small subunit